MTSSDNPDDAETQVLGSFPGPASSPRSGGRGAAPPSLSTGFLLADRFRIIRFIAQGGMGEVYEADDLELRDRVALKTSVRSNVALAAGRVHAAAGRLAEAAKSFRTAFDEARRSGISGATLEARLALAENDRRSGKSSDAQRALATLETEARARGFLQVAAKAARVRA